MLIRKSPECRITEDDEREKFISRIMSKIVILDMRIRNKEKIPLVNDVVDGCEWEAHCHFCMKK